MKQKKYQSKNRKTMIILALISVLVLIAGFVIVSTKMFYPYHTLVGYLAIIASIGTFIWSIRRYFKILKNLETLNTVQAFVLSNKISISVILAILLIAIIVLTIVPLRKNAFRGMTPDEVHNKVESDLASATVILDHLEITGDKLLNSGLLKKESFTADERGELTKHWGNFLISAYESEVMTDVHTYFHFIPIISQPEDHAKSFLIAYSLYLKKSEIVSRIINEIQSNESVKKVLNEKIKNLEVDDFYKRMAEGYYHPKTILRINIGQAYLQTLIDKVYGNGIENKNYLVLLEVAKSDYIELKDRLGDTILNSAKVGSEKIEKGLFSLWFPIQKNIAKGLGHTYISQREGKFITVDQINEMQKEMQPGDIMLQRRNWYMSNIGIPGFWAHAALYTGTLDELDEFFKSEFPYKEFEKFSDYLKSDLPDVFAKFNEDVDGYKQAVIEGKEPGIILQPLEVSANADYVVTLRPKLEKQDILLSLVRAFENYGKPYDFNFDFETRDSMVCSELVYDAYQKQEGKAGIDFPLSFLNGRKIMAPVDIAKKFRDEYKNDDDELEFVYFLDGNEEEGIAVKKDVDEFILTLGRPKYSFWLQ